MQSFSCSSKLPNIEDYGTVTDTRDNNTYTVAKLKDGKCWMTQNLRIINKTVNSTYSDMTSGSFTIPNATAANGFTGTNNNAAYYNSSTNSTYYSWYTATAGSGTSSIASGNASKSICPKSWRLPTHEEAVSLSNVYPTGLLDPPVNFTLAGRIYGNNYEWQRNDYDFFWTSTAYDASRAYEPNTFKNGSLDANHAGYGKFEGVPIRCIFR